MEERLVGTPNGAHVSEVVSNTSHNTILCVDVISTVLFSDLTGLVQAVGVGERGWGYKCRTPRTY